MKTSRIVATIALVGGVLGSAGLAVAGPTHQVPVQPVSTAPPAPTVATAEQCDYELGCWAYDDALSVLGAAVDEYKQSFSSAPALIERLSPKDWVMLKGHFGNASVTACKNPDGTDLQVGSTGMIYCREDDQIYIGQDVLWSQYVQHPRKVIFIVAHALAHRLQSIDRNVDMAKDPNGLTEPYAYCVTGVLYNIMRQQLHPDDKGKIQADVVAQVERAEGVVINGSILDHLLQDFNLGLNNDLAACDKKYPN